MSVVGRRSPIVGCHRQSSVTNSRLSALGSRFWVASCHLSFIVCHLWFIICCCCCRELLYLLLLLLQCCCYGESHIKIHCHTCDRLTNGDFVLYAPAPPIALLSFWGVGPSSFTRCVCGIDCPFLPCCCVKVWISLVLVPTSCSFRRRLRHMMKRTGDLPNNCGIRSLQVNGLSSLKAKHVVLLGYSVNCKLNLPGFVAQFRQVVRGGVIPCKTQVQKPGLICGTPCRFPFPAR